MDVRETLRKSYAGEPFVQVLPEGMWPHTGATLGSNARNTFTTVSQQVGSAS